MTKRTTNDEDIVLARNDQVDRRVVMAYKRLARELRMLGVRRKPRYNIEPPLGRKPRTFHNRSE